MISLYNFEKDFLRNRNIVDFKLCVFLYTPFYYNTFILTGFTVYIFMMPDIPDVQDADLIIGINSCFRAAVKSCNYFFHIAYLETCM